MPVFEKERSKIKMVILTKPKCENKTWYSPIKQNQKPRETIIAGMIRRLKANPIFNDTQVVQFYEGQELIAESKRTAI